MADWINKASNPNREADSCCGAAGSDGPYAGVDDSVVLIGGDADLVVQCLALPFASNLFVYNPQNVEGRKRCKGRLRMCMPLMALRECFWLRV